MSASLETEFMLQGLFRTPRISLDEVCKIVGVTKDTAYVMRSNGKFPIPMSGKPLKADIRDVAIYIDEMRKKAA